jgi:hypothetical protein
VAYELVQYLPSAARERDDGTIATAAKHDFLVNAHAADGA